MLINRQFGIQISSTDGGYCDSNYFNYYTYVRNDPVNAVDPSGLDPLFGPKTSYPEPGTYKGHHGTIIDDYQHTGSDTNVYIGTRFWPDDPRQLGGARELQVERGDTVPDRPYSPSFITAAAPVSTGRIVKQAGRTAVQGVTSFVVNTANTPSFVMGKIVDQLGGDGSKMGKFPNLVLNNDTAADPHVEKHILQVQNATNAVVGLATVFYGGIQLNRRAPLPEYSQYDTVNMGSAGEAPTGSNVLHVNNNPADLAPGVSGGRLIADAADLPLTSGSVKLVQANFIPGDIQAATGMIKEAYRILQPGKTAVFSSSSLANVKQLMIDAGFVDVKMVGQASRHFYNGRFLMPALEYSGTKPLVAP